MKNKALYYVVYSYESKPHPQCALWEEEAMYPHQEAPAFNLSRFLNYKLVNGERPTVLSWKKLTDEEISALYSSGDMAGIKLID